MNNKNQGFTLIELMVSIVVLGILVMMVSSITNTTSKAHRKEVLINEMDKTLGKSIDFIKRSARMAQEAESNYNLPTGFYSATTKLPIIIGGPDGNDKEKESEMVIINYSEEVTTNNYIDNQILYYYDSDTKSLRVKTRKGTGSWEPANGEPIALNVTNASFMYDESVLRIKISIDLNNPNMVEENWKKKTVVDAAVVRTIVRGAN